MHSPYQVYSPVYQQQHMRNGYPPPQNGRFVPFFPLLLPFVAGLAGGALAGGALLYNRPPYPYPYPPQPYPGYPPGYQQGYQGGYPGYQGYPPQGYPAAFGTQQAVTDNINIYTGSGRLTNQ